MLARNSSAQYNSSSSYFIHGPCSVLCARQLACHNETYAICLTFISDQLYTRPAAYTTPAMHDEQNMNILWRASLFSS
jgi:hypothetical protein